MNVFEKTKALIFKNMNCTEEEYLSWHKNKYGMDKKIRDKFLSLVDKADKIRIFGDYDVDGICASFVLSTGIQDYKGTYPIVRLPKRFSEGFGIKEKQIDEMYEEDKEELKSGKNILLITVDNGIAASSCLEKAKKYGYTVCVTDHHELGNNSIPDVDLVIDPKVKGHNPFDSEHYCGAGVCYKIVENMDIKPSLLKELEIYAGMATVCDVMKLREDNHKIVKNTLTNIRAGHIPNGLKLLGDNKDFDFNFITEDDFGYTFGPMFNAMGRLYDDGAIQVYNYLVNPSIEKAKEIFLTNEERKDIVKEEYQEVLNTMVKNNDVIDLIHRKTGEDEYKLKEDIPFRPTVVYVPNLHEGIVGILAGNISEEFNIPCIILTSTENKNIVKGSARSVEGFNIFEYLNEINKTNPEIFAGFGGHEGAAGLSVNTKELKTLKKISLDKEYDKPLEKDNSLDVISINKDQIPALCDLLEEYRPFGEGNKNIDFKVTLHRYYDKPKFVGANKDSLMITKKDYKILMFHVKDNMPKGNVFTINGNINLGSYKGNKSITFLGNEINPYEKIKNKDIDTTKVKETDVLDFDERYAE